MQNTNTVCLVQLIYRSREANTNKIKRTLLEVNRNMSTGMIVLKKVYIFYQFNKDNDLPNPMVLYQVGVKSVNISTKFLHFLKH